MWFWFWPWLRMGFDNPTFRRALMPDSRRMAAIHAEGFAIGWPVEDIERMLLAGHVADVLVSRAAPFGEVVTGFAISRVVLDEAELLTIALDREVRGRALAMPLLMRHARKVRQAGARVLFLEVAGDNAPALALYRAAGFAEIGRRKAYYPPHEAEGPRRDALTMRWDIEHLDPTPRPD